MPNRHDIDAASGATTAAPSDAVCDTTSGATTSAACDSASGATTSAACDTTSSVTCDSASGATSAATPASERGSAGSAADPVGGSSATEDEVQDLIDAVAGATWSTRNRIMEERFLASLEKGTAKVPTFKPPGEAIGSD